MAPTIPPKWQMSIGEVEVLPFDCSPLCTAQGEYPVIESVTCTNVDDGTVVTLGATPTVNGQQVWQTVNTETDALVAGEVYKLRVIVNIYPTPNDRVLDLVLEIMA